MPICLASPSATARHRSTMKPTGAATPSRLKEKGWRVLAIGDAQDTILADVVQRARLYGGPEQRQCRNEDSTKMLRQWHDDLPLERSSGLNAP